MLLKAFNAFIATCDILQQISFGIPAALLLYQRRPEHLLPRARSFRLPKALGYVANSACVLWSLITTVFYLFPAIRPVTTSNMSKLDCWLSTILSLVEIG